MKESTTVGRRGVRYVTPDLSDERKGAGGIGQKIIDGVEKKHTYQRTSSGMLILWQGS